MTGNRQQIERRFQITAGPSREELFDALRLRHEGRKIFFTLKDPTLRHPGQRFEFQVNNLGIEDGSGNNWMFKIYDPCGMLGSQYLNGFYNTTSRHGNARLT